MKFLKNKIPEDHILNKLNFKALSVSKNFNNVQIKIRVFTLEDIYLFKILFSSALRSLLRAF